MDGIEALLSGMGHSDCGKTALAGEALADFRASYQHIADLKPGDKVQWKPGMRDSKVPAMGEIVEIFRVTPIRLAEAKGSNHDLDENDFTLAFRDDNGDYQEYAFDSRRFERVE